MMHENMIIDCVNNRDQLYIGRSGVHNVGLFGNIDLKSGHRWIAGEGNVKYLCGRFMNHSSSPNCVFEYYLKGDTIVADCMTLRKIPKGEELTVCYIENYHKYLRILSQKKH
jgi:hypothetical protein